MEIELKEFYILSLEMGSPTDKILFECFYWVN